jgi:3-oxoacyl-[acyl-carrier-protein] synthase-3
VKRYAEIIGWGKYVPPKVLHNRDLERLVETTDEWIRTRTGIVERRMAGPKETTATMAVRAAQEALAVADFNPARLEFIIVATCTPDYPLPAVACQVQDALGAGRAGAVDINAGCSGFVYALAMGTALIAAGMYRNVLVIGADTLTRILDFTDRRTCILFGDGAGAVLLHESDRPTGLLAYTLGADGSGVDLLYIPAGGSRQPASLETVQNRLHYLRMNGNEVYRFAVNTVVRATQQVLKEAGLTVEDLALFIPHQANIRIIQSAARTLGLPPEKVYTNVDRYGNTSAASIPIALCEAIAEGRVKPGDYLAMVGFGAGLTWAAAVVQWGAPAAVRHPWWKQVLHSLWGPEAGLRSLARRTSRRLAALGGRENGLAGPNGHRRTPARPPAGGEPRPER